MKKIGINHVPSSAYHPQSNSMAEREVRSLMDLLAKTRGPLTDLQLDELVFCINGHVQPGERGSALDRFFNRSVRTLLPNSIDLSKDPEKMITSRLSKHKNWK